MIEPCALVTVVDSMPSPAMMPATCVPWPSVSTRLCSESPKTRTGATAARHEIRMFRVNARVVHLHHHVRAGEAQIIRRRLQVQRHAHRRPRQIIRRHAPVKRLDNVHVGICATAATSPTFCKVNNGPSGVVSSAAMVTPSFWSAASVASAVPGNAATFKSPAGCIVRHRCQQ